MSNNMIFLSPDFYQKIVEESTKWGVAFINIMAITVWSGIKQNLQYIIGLFFVFSVIAVFKALSGETGMLGSMLYHLFFFTILGIIIWIKGAEILFNTWFDLISFLIYMLSFKLTGLILAKLKK